MRKPDNKNDAYDALDVGVAVVDADGRILSWNSWLADASGVPKVSAIGSTLESVLPNSGKRFATALKQSFEFGASSVLTHSLNPDLLPLRTRAGKKLVHDLSIKPMGAMPYGRCLIQVLDVTASAERERVLRERHDARYASVVDNAPDALLTTDDEGVIQFANAVVFRDLGYAPDELIGKPVSMLLRDQADWSLLRLAIKQASPGHGIQVLGQRKDGAETQIELSASRWSDRSRHFLTIILRDVNARYAAEEALRRLNETLEARVASTLAERKLLADIVENMDAYILVVDPDLKVLAINKATAEEFERRYGTRPGVGQALSTLMAETPDGFARVSALWKRALSGEIFTALQEVDDPERGVQHYELKFAALRNSRGKRIAAYQFAYDITERVERQQQLLNAEEALRQSQKMEAIGQLTGGIAHDFNNLLAGIIGAMELLKRRIKAGRYEDTQRFMDAAVTSANRAAALTHRLLAFARRQPLDPRAIDPNELIRGMEDLLRRTMGEQVHINVDLRTEPWLINSDANQLENAILNLAINARDAMPDGGALTISTRNITTDDVTDTFGTIPAGEYTLISVKDTGAGIARDFIEKVFEPFFTTKPIGQGTGLGLSMVYGFAQQSGGHARIESAEGKGTEIKIYLPRYRGVVETNFIDKDSATTPKGEGETVLLVEDDSAVRLLIGEVLRDLGYRCVEASDADAALPMLASNARLDLLITDVGLPKINGRELATIARRHRPGLKVLFVTGYAEHATGVEKFLEPGMALVTKPFNLDALALKIRDMIALSSR